MLIGVTTTIVRAQTSDDVMRYSFEFPSYDPVTLVMPGVATHTGFGAYQDNPAAMAFAEEGYFSFSLSSRFVSEDGTYLGNTTDFSDSGTSVGDLGFVYKFPTKRGSLVIGGGYSQSTDYNRALAVNAYNEQTTITDYYNSTLVADPLYFAAYDAFALYDPNPDDDSYANTRPSFRADPGGYQGIRQDMELTEGGQRGKYFLFLATEAMKNLFIGGSIGYSSGTYTYRRNFLEIDENNYYTNNVMNTDIDRILSYDKIDASIQGFSAQAGLVYQPVEWVNIGVSYEFPSKFYIDEDYNTVITTTFDNGETAEADAPGEFSYEVTIPQRLKAGLTLTGLQGLTFSAMGEYVPYWRAEYNEESTSQAETDINQNIEAYFNDVVNVRAGLEYEVNPRFTPRIGYGFYPSPVDALDRARQFVSGGFTATLSQGISVNLGLQYSFWEDSNALYQYPLAGDETGAEIAQEDVSRLNVMGGIKMNF